MAGNRSLEIEIGSLKRTLLALDKGEQPMDTISDHKPRITEVLASSDLSVLMKDTYCPIRDLLSVKPLEKVEVPLDILDLLLSRFNVNDGRGEIRSLQLAIINDHFLAARFLVAKGADVYHYNNLPIIYLAMKRDVPLDLFNILATDETLNGRLGRCPLHVSVQYNNIAIARRLMQLGANINTKEDHVDG
jgi:hypothetical protein